MSRSGSVGELASGEWDSGFTHVHSTYVDVCGCTYVVDVCGCMNVGRSMRMYADACGCMWMYGDVCRWVYVSLCFSEAASSSVTGEENKRLSHGALPSSVRESVSVYLCLCVRVPVWLCLHQRGGILLCHWSAAICARTPDWFSFAGHSLATAAASCSLFSHTIDSILRNCWRPG